MAPNKPNTEYSSHPMRALCEEWLRKIEVAKKVKQERFGCYADEAMKFYDGAHDFMWKDEYARAQGGFLDKTQNAALPTFRMTVNRVFEAVAVFGPALYHQNPQIEVTPVHPPQIDPMLLGINPEDPAMAEQYQMMVMQQQQEQQSRGMYGKLKQHYLNWLQVESDKKTHARRSITEALVKGMGILWTDMYQPKGSSIKYPRSMHISVDDIVVDPDAEYWEDVQWIARYCCHPVNLTAREYDLDEKELEGHLSSIARQASEYGAGKRVPRNKRTAEAQERKGESFDLIEYWRVYSKNGFGDRLKQTKGKAKSKINFEMFGDFCYLAVAKNIPFPLNLPTSALLEEDEDTVFQRSQWPIPFWADGGWPMSRLSFYEKPRDVWPISLIKPAIGELRFVNWCMSFLADKVAASAGSYVAVAKDAGMSIQNQLQSGLAPFTVLEISQITGRSINDVISFIEAPEFRSDIWKMVADVIQMIDKRTGLTDLVYGLTESQMRSATEANVREENINVRPDDMAARVEEFLSEAAMKEMEAICWMGERQDLIPVLGELGAYLFEQRQQTTEFDSVVRDFEYRVEANSARKPNKRDKMRSLNELGQVIMPTIQQLATGGIIGPWNAYVAQVCEVMDMEPGPFMIELPEPEEQGPSPEEMEAQIKQLELEVKKQQMILDQQAHEQELQQEEERHKQEMKQDKEEHVQNMLLERAKRRVVMSNGSRN